LLAQVSPDRPSPRRRRRSPRSGLDLEHPIAVPEIGSRWRRGSAKAAEVRVELSASEPAELPPELREGAAVGSRSSAKSSRRGLSPRARWPGRGAFFLNQDLPGVTVAGRLYSPCGRRVALASVSSPSPSARGRGQIWRRGCCAHVHWLLRVMPSRASCSWNCSSERSCSPS
jgi:hypothetical protein